MFARMFLGVSQVLQLWYCRYSLVGFCRYSTGGGFLVLGLRLLRDNCSDMLSLTLDSTVTTLLLLVVVTTVTPLWRLVHPWFDSARQCRSSGHVCGYVCCVSPLLSSAQLWYIPLLLVGIYCYLVVVNRSRQRHPKSFYGAVRHVLLCAHFPVLRSSA